MPDPKILVLDIETAPAKAYVWGLFDQNIGLNQLIEPGRTIMVGCKWVGDKTVHIFDEYADKDAMWIRVHRMLSEADAVVTYNGNRFDLPRLNGHFIDAGLDPLPPITSIDLLRTVKKMGLQSNKLEYVSSYLDIGHKIKHEGFPLWAGWMDREDRAVKKMRRYCRGDVLLTERLYTRLRPYISNHPYLGAGVAKDREAYECPHCGDTKRFQQRGFYRTRNFRTARIQCQNCGGWGKGKKEKVI